LEQSKFIADVHLGKLAKWLRILGIDISYATIASYEDLVRMAEEESRIILSRGASFLKNEKISSLQIISEDSVAQLKQVIRTFNLSNRLKPFTRCLVCNGELIEVSKSEIIDKLNENTRQYFDEFWRCSSCEQIYWKGSHYERMTKMLNDLQIEENQGWSHY
jgi:hypothetical protein